ncbi:hypothetical protein EJB05_54293, partial [Eragrostis curvula]
MPRSHAGRSNGELHRLFLYFVLISFLWPLRRGSESSHELIPLPSQSRSGGWSAGQGPPPPGRRHAHPGRSGSKGTKATTAFSARLVFFAPGSGSRPQRAPSPVCKLLPLHLTPPVVRALLAPFADLVCFLGFLGHPPTRLDSSVDIGSELAIDGVMQDGTDAVHAATSSPNLKANWSPITVVLQSFMYPYNKYRHNSRSHPSTCLRFYGSITCTNWEKKANHRAWFTADCHRIGI